MTTDLGIGGVHGRLLRVDLGEDAGEGGPSHCAEIFADVIGGIGLASLLLLRLCPPGADPLGPDNPLIFATSPFVGTGITTASKIAVAARSPQTGMIGDSLSSSYLALALKRTGHDALAITGRAPHGACLSSTMAGVACSPRDELLGLSPGATADRLRAELGTGSFGWRRSARPASAGSATRRSPMTAAWPGAPAPAR